MVLALALASQGVIQNFSPYKDVTTLEPLTWQQPKTDAAGNPVKDAAGNPVQETLSTHTQTLPMGPIASQESIKELGTNGGGFLNANSAHPYENPTALSNLLEMLAIVLIPAALTYTFGRMVGVTRLGWAVLAAMLILFVTLLSVAAGRAGAGNPGPHGFSEILYAFSSAGNNNGSAFAGISANTPFYNTALALTMWLGRFWPIVAVLAVAGSLAAKKRIPVSDGTMPTHGPTFVVLLIGTVLLVGALTFVPALALGPIVEHVMLWAGP